MPIVANIHVPIVTGIHVPIAVCPATPPHSSTCDIRDMGAEWKLVYDCWRLLANYYEFGPGEVWAHGASFIDQFPGPTAALGRF